MTTTPQDDSFHEIQLSGKQLFFLFMAATVVSVVIFLCGVLVGRGVRIERTAVAEAELLNTSPRADAQPAVTSDAAVPAPIDRTIVPPPPPGDDIVEIRPNTPLVPDAASKGDTQRPAPAKAGKPETATRAATPGKAPAPSATTPGPAPAKAPDVATAPTASAGWVVQVAALTTSDAADAYTKRLATKGYPAYVVAAAGTSTYRVRVGSFKSRREANVMADKLRKDLQVTPFVTR